MSKILSDEVITRILGILRTEGFDALSNEIKASPAHDGEVVAWLHTVRDAKSREGDTDLALSFDHHSFPLDSIGWVSIKAQPLFTAPPRVVDVDDAMVERACKAAFVVVTPGLRHDIRAALKAALEKTDAS